MKNFCNSIQILVVLCLMVLPFSVKSQFYYKDIISTRQINQTFSAYLKNKVSSVKLATFNGSTPITEGFLCEQKVSYRPNKVVTYTNAADAGESWLSSFYNAAGLLTKSIDSTIESVSSSWYEYDADSRLVLLKNYTRAVDNSSSTIESHHWKYNSSGKPMEMIRIKNNKDTSIVKFNQDENGNPGEEESFAGKVSQGKIYYYFDEEGRLTDVVRYNSGVGRLLPYYMFEYEDNGDLSSMTVVPEGSSDYQKWYYKYDDTGLKLADFCYNKRNELLGKVEYEYR